MRIEEAVYDKHLEDYHRRFEEYTVQHTKPPESFMAQRMRDKVVVITGAGSGIGRQTAVRCAQEGAAVVCSDLNEEGAQQTVSEITTQLGSAVAVRTDVTSPKDCEHMVQTALSQFGRLNGIFANAGITGEGTAENTPLDNWNRVIAVNLTGVYLSCQAAIPQFLAQGDGVILATASVAGISGVPGTASYSAAKAGVVGLVRQLAADYSQHQIRANAICPGTVPTPLVVSAYEQRGYLTGDGVAGAFARASARFPMKRVGRIDDPAWLAVFLLSDESGWITGQAIAVDGGLSQVAWQPGQ
jgi:NAD(P)-dependent dehydrogenase (short-subunit alcohol dehydrogenase family)